MTIAIHIPEARIDRLRKNFNYRCFTRMAAEHFNHHFIFIFDSPPDPELYLDKNITAVIASPQLKNSLLKHYWYNFKIPSILDKYNASVFITGGNACSLRTRVPQCMIIEAITFKSAGKYLKKFLPAFLKTASLICTTNLLMRDELLNKFTVNENKILTVYPEIDENTATLESPEAIREKYTAGKDYFLLEVNETAEKHLVQILKAFSIFKKWQHSDMQLVLYLRKDLNSSVLKDLSLYKYRNELVYVSSVQAMNNMAAAAYAVISITPDDPAAALLAMKYNVPVITFQYPFNKITFEDAAVFTIAQESDIAEKMIALYKNEHFRNGQVAKGNMLAAKYSWPATTSRLWDALETLAANKS